MEIRWKHLIHCVALLTTIFVAIRKTINVEGKIYPGNEYSWPVQIIFYFLTLLPLYTLPYNFYTVMGLLLYDCFPGEVHLKANLNELPAICFRVVTRGSFPKLILDNLKRNLSICRELQLPKYLVEIVTETPIDGQRDAPNIKQTIVPQSYTTPKGTLFKARNLQYALETSDLKDNDWIVHLDEDAILTGDAVKGVCNFVSLNEHPFGVGLIDFNVHGIVDLLTESLEVFPFFDYGEIRFQALCMKRPQYIIRSTFLVANVSAEKKVSFDVEAGPSIMEDAAFALLMRHAGYTFGLVEGKILEQGTTSLRDHISSRTRWFI